MRHETATAMEDGIEGAHLRTERLELVPATVESLTWELDAVDRLGRFLDCDIAPGWPPDLYDESATRYTLDRLEHALDDAGWWMWYILLQRGRAQRPVLVGTCGFKGAPAPNGTVEIGYGVVGEFQRRGIATEATRRLIEYAFGFEEVRAVLAETHPDHDASIGVLVKCGFEPVGPGSESEVVRFAVWRGDAGRVL